MRLQPLLTCKHFGFKVFPVGYSNEAYDNGRHKFVERYLENDIATKRLMFVEQINAPTAIGGVHKRAAVPVIVYSTKAIIDIIQDPFVVQVTNEPFCTEKPLVKAWLRVGGRIGETSSSYQPMLIVRDTPEIDLKRVDQYFQFFIEMIERRHKADNKGQENILDPLDWKQGTKDGYQA